MIRVYERKTYDVWRVYVMYVEECGFEEVFEANTRKEAKDVRRSYLDEGYACIIKKHRVRKEN